jgi:hypothetical protein
VYTHKHKETIEKLATRIYEKLLVKVEQLQEEVTEFDSTFICSQGQIQMVKNGKVDPQSSTRQVHLIDNPEQIGRAVQLVKDVIAEVLCFSNMVKIDNHGGDRSF